MRYLTYFLKLRQHFLSSLSSISGAVHRIVDDKIVGAELINDVRVGLAPKFGEVLGDDLQVLNFFLSRHFAQWVKL